MVCRVSDLLAERATETFVGRTGEIADLLGLLEDDGRPLVMHVHGAAGIGKSSLLTAFAVLARAQGSTVVTLDCRVIEPTPRGFIHELGAAVGVATGAVDDITGRLSQFGGRVVLTLDTYELFGLLDTWLRQVFIPALSDNVRVILAGREPPILTWNLAPEWQGLFGAMSLEPLNDEEAIDLLTRTGVTESDSRRIKRIAKGHPLALKLAASTIAERPELDLEEIAIPMVVHELTRLYLAEIDDPLTRRAVEASSVVRRSTQSVLGAMLMDAAPRDVYERLSSLQIMESGRDGLVMHDAVREAVAAALKSSDPARHQDYRRAGWRQLRSEVRTAAIADLWCYTADMLYMIENPVIREAFFPSGSQQLTVEPARPEDEGSVMAIVQRHERPHAAEAIELWWKRAPHAFHVIRDGDHGVAGFYCMLDSDSVARSSLADDPIVAAWFAHLADDPTPNGRRLFCLDDGLAKNMGRCRPQCRPHAGSTSNASTWSCAQFLDACT
ncbi:MAG: AAA family ATPase [SAR202 cluster bacterium]|nr:AAA family ATPase [SAR202 cluster bacterium]